MSVLSDDAVEHVDIGTALILSTSAGVRITIETEFVITLPNGPNGRVHPESGVLPVGAHEQLLGPLKEIRWTADGNLTISYQSGSKIEVVSSSDFEAWNVVTAGGALTVSVPGGGLATFPGRD